MKTKFLLVSILISAGLMTSAFAASGRGNGGSGPNTARPAPNCNLTGPGQGTPLRDGSGKTTAPGKGPKDGTGNNANCPNPPTG